MRTGSAPARLLFRDVEVSLGSHRVIAGLSFELRDREILAVVGPNGAGKTTLLRTALGLLVPSRGDVLLDGAPATSISPLARAQKMAWLPQSENFQDNITVEEFVALGRYPHLGSFGAAGGGDREAVERALKEADVLRFRGRGMLELSGGERQRVLFARSLAQEAPLLLLDEPTNHLDMGYQLQVMQDLDRFRREHPGRAVLISLHDINLASRFSDRILWLTGGRADVLGSPQETITSERIYRVYGVEADIHHQGKDVYVFPPRPRGPAPGSDPGGPRVHVICGGGCGGPLLRSLSEAGFRVTAGVLPLLDSDQELCTLLRIPTVVEAPFTPISEEARAEQRRYLKESDIIVVSPLVVGTGNLANLVDALPWASARRMYLVGGAPGSERDFVGGAAREAYARLVEGGAREVEASGLVPLLLKDRWSPAKEAT